MSKKQLFDDTDADQKFTTFDDRIKIEDEIILPSLQKEFPELYVNTMQGQGDKYDAWHLPTKRTFQLKTDNRCKDTGRIAIDDKLDLVRDEVDYLMLNNPKIPNELGEILFISREKWKQMKEREQLVSIPGFPGFKVIRRERVILYSDGIYDSYNHQWVQIPKELQFLQ